MEVSGGEEEGFVREWTPCSHMLSLIPARVQTGLFSSELRLTCIDACSEYIALGTNVGLVYWYDRKKGNIQRLRCEATTSPITYVKIANTVDYMVGAGNAAGQVTVFQIPKEHPESVPDALKPKVTPKVERYTIGDLHKSTVTAIEWSKNGMRLFSGDKNGVIIMTEIDFYMHLTKSMEIVNEQHEIVQMSYYQNTLLVSSVYRSILCERRDARWQVNQLGKKERRSLSRLGAVFQHSYSPGGAGGAGGAGVYCARGGLRLWRAAPTGDVLQTLLFKEAINNPLTVVELLNPATNKRAPPADKEYNFGPLYVFKEHFLVSHNEDLLYILDPRSLTAVAVVDQMRKILSVSVNRDEIFVLEGPRSVLRLGHAPEPGARLAGEPVNLMSRSLTSSLQQAVNTVRDLTHINQTMPFITSVLEQPISILTRHEFVETGGAVSSAEECFELPPIKQLPSEMAGHVLESIVDEFRDVTSETDELRRIKSEELQRKLALYNSIMERQQSEELIHSRRHRERGAGSTPARRGRGGTPAGERGGAPAEDVSYASPCLMDMSVYGITQVTDEVLEKQIEEKEKILAKMLNLESLSITSSDTDHKADITEPPPQPQTKNKEAPKPEPEILYQIQPNRIKKPEKAKDLKQIDLVPKMVKLPNTWNLGDIELNLDIPNSVSEKRYMSPEEGESEWEFV